MNDRVQSALRGLGIGVAPAASLEREGAFFALLEDTLIYQDAGGTRRVTLRDLTRIHSDQDGLLRVETPAGTALTASLVGYDPARVQTFFAQVRDATARAKHLPPSPLPSMSGQKTFGSSPAPSAPPPNRDPAAPAAPPAREEANPPEGRPPSGKAEEAQTPERPAGRSDPPPPRERTAPPAARPTQWKPLSPNDLGGETVRVIGPAASVQARTATPAPVPETAPPPPPRSAPVVLPPVAAPVPVTGEATPAGPPQPVTRTRERLARGGLAGLNARAEGVLGWVGRLRLLAAVLGLAALGLAAFQFADGPRLAGLWTLIAGGVGALALLAFAEVTELVVALARAVALGVGEPGGERASEQRASDPDA